ncbi:MAG TPA: Asp-tRNA(Asn)/Glu-tRNA(Gln) amidotransferase subunit GatC [Planctomycetota bacterium]|nr:Asp-tRNA(Asn)/Glu-tRNA(Gln) amidotransferase subunit GatC [Planctomycetota bacterium]
MVVTEALVRHVARLARLELTDAEVAAMVPQLARILSHVEAIAGVDAGAPVETAAVPPLSTAALRGDEPVAGLDRREALANAPAHDQVFFLVPRVLGDD